MNKLVKILVWTCVLFVVLSCIGCNKKSDAQPLFKVITSSQVGTTIFTNKQYYVVYSNGKTKKITEFSTNDVIGYAFNPDAESKDEPYLHLIDINTSEGRLLNDYAKNIFLLTEKDDNGDVFSPGKLLIINEHFYFTALIERGFNSVKNGLFEYIVDDNSFKKIATFNDSISHVEPYQ